MRRTGASSDPCLLPRTAGWPAGGRTPGTVAQWLLRAPATSRGTAGRKGSATRNRRASGEEMNCLTEEQIAQLALGLSNGDVQLTAHVETCDACRSKVADVRQLTSQLEAIHTTRDQMHATLRERLLAIVANIDVPAERRTAASWLAQQLDRLTIRQRLAAGGVGLTTAVGLILLLIVWGSAERLSAMERMVKQLRTGDVVPLRALRTQHI